MVMVMVKEKLFVSMARREGRGRNGMDHAMYDYCAMLLLFFWSQRALFYYLFFKLNFLLFALLVQLGHSCILLPFI